MDGVHDLGGVHGFGPVAREENEPTFHAPWEAAVVAIMRATLGRSYNLDEFRHAVERMDPAHYLGSSYYEHWLDGIARVLTEKGVVSPDELEARTAFFQERPGASATAALTAPPVVPTAALGMIPETSVREARETPRFARGDVVVTRNIHPRGHTRLPRYARAKRGVIVAWRGTHVFPDANAHGLGEQPQPLYTVRFDACELWGDAAEPNHHVHLDLWESYLLPG
jgi:nitrile hydratase beta subunit